MSLTHRGEYASAEQLAQERVRGQSKAACKYRQHFYGKNAGELYTNNASAGAIE